MRLPSLSVNPRARALLPAAVATLLALAMWLTMFLAEPRTSPTQDEFWHMVRGIAAVRAPDSRLSWPHPPLAQAVAMLPVSLRSDRDIGTLRGFDTASVPAVTMAYVRQDYAGARAELRAGRLVNATLAAGFVLFIFRWLRARMGTVAAFGASALYASCPIVLAHGALVTTDFATGALTILALAALLAYLEHGSWWRLACAALALGALPAVKVSGIVVVATMALIPLAWLAMKRGIYAGRKRSSALLLLLRDYVVVGLAVLFVVNAVYRFDRSFLTPEQLSAIVEPSFAPKKRPMERVDAARGVLALWPKQLPVPLPFTYVFSVDFIREKDQVGHANVWFGKVLRHGTALYFPAMLATKTQAVLLPLIVVGFVLDARRMLRGPGKWLLVVGLLFLAVAMRSGMNIGVRHVFPTLLCLILLGGMGFSILIDKLKTRHAIAQPALAGVFSAALGYGAWSSFPAYIGDFNAFVGQSYGHRMSSIAEDWGQDTVNLARELKARDIRNVFYTGRHAHSFRELAHQGIDGRHLACSAQPPPGAIVAIHRTRWDRNRNCYRAFRRQQPEFSVNENILVFRARPAKPADRMLPKREARSARQNRTAQTDVADKESGEGGRDGT